ncbi:MAG: cytochrome C, partial [Methylococcaceae bacterium]|nr:cytochrome C [Methylococcaceae bacterium]
MAIHRTTSERGLLANLVFRSVLLLSAAALLPYSTQAAAGKIRIAKAGWSQKTSQLTIKGKATNDDGPVSIYDINGRWLGSSEAGSFSLNLARADLVAVPCAIRVVSGATESIKSVKGAPKSCAKAPTCRIEDPAPGTVLQAGVDTPFTAVAATKDRKAQPLTYEWDFAGGSMGELIAGANPPAYQRPKGLSTTVAFVRDNSHYRVRFIATDAKGRRCEDSVEVVVGTPPSGLPAKVVEQPAPVLGGELDGTKDDVVVMP